MTIVTPAEFKTRREKFVHFLGNDVAILHGAKELIRNGDVHFPFRQNSFFYYLTGFNEPDAIAVFKDGEFILFNRPRNPEREIWDGKRAGQEGAIQHFGANHAYPIETYDEKIKSFTKGRKVRDEKEIQQFLSDCRLIKSPDEIKTMRKANEISINSHLAVLQHAKSSQYEFELQGIFTGHCLRQGSQSMAYSPIVAAGKNACTLHYVENNQKIHKDDCILIDAGCEFENYASDITRVFPMSGKFTGQQKAVYDIVYEAQRAAIDHIKPGIKWPEPQEMILNILVQGLADLKLLHGNIENLIEQKAFLPYYMHNFGHWLGLDVHDVGGYRMSNSETRQLQPGTVLTIEPGLYISEWNIGVRIEDNILVTEHGYENLTERLPRKSSDIEAVMNS